MTKEFLLSGGDWMVTHSLPSEYAPGASSVIRTLSRGNLYGPDWVKAQVPGDVQSDMIDAGEIAPIEYGFNARLAEWTYQRDWTYVRRFGTPHRPAEGGSAYLRFDGVDYLCDVFLNGIWLGRHEGAWNPFEYEVSGLLRPGEDNVLAVQIKNAPDEQGQHGRTSLVKTLKSRFAYGWDWCARMVPLGIVGDVRLIIRPGIYIDDVYAYADVDAESRKTVVHFKTDIISKNENEVEGSRLEARLSRDGKLKASGSGELFDHVLSLEVADAELWYPNGYGVQPLYDAEVVLSDRHGREVSAKRFKFGIRDIRWEKNDGAGGDAFPYVMVVNGKRVFMRGFNWTPPRQLYGRPHTEVYERRLELARRANVTTLRAWGSGIGEKEIFYDLCDRYGIVVIQELFQSSAAIDNNPSTDPAFISLLCDVAGGFIRRVRNHASIAAWCGGNELCVRGGVLDIHGNVLKPEFLGWEHYKLIIPGSDPWIPLAGDYPTLAALKNVVDAEAPDRLWLPTSASGPFENASLDKVGRMHDVHGPWQNLGPTAHYEFYNKVDMMLHSEFGCDGAATPAAMAKYLPEGKAWPPDATNPYAWNRGRMWTSGNKARTEAYFGPLDDLETYMRASRHVQGESLRYAVEAHRRRSWQCSGALVWHFAEPWPNLCDTCCVDFDNIPKPAYYAIARANRPITVSARYDTVQWGGHGSFEAEIYALNSTGSDFGARVETSVWNENGELLYFNESDKALSGEVNGPIDKISIPLENLTDDLFILKCAIRGIDDPDTLLSESWSVHSKSAERPYESLQKPETGRAAITACLENESLSITNIGRNFLIGLTIESLNDDRVFYSDNWLCLAPGEHRKIEIAGDPGKISLSAWNLHKIDI